MYASVRRFDSIGFVVFDVHNPLRMQHNSTKRLEILADYLANLTRNNFWLKIFSLKCIGNELWLKNWLKIDAKGAERSISREAPGGGSGCFSTLFRTSLSNIFRTQIFAVPFCIYFF